MARRIAVACCAWLVVLALATGVAQAGTGTVSIAGGIITFTAAAGDANSVFVSHPGGDSTRIRIDEDGVGASISAPACTAVNTSQVDCPAAGITQVHLVLGDDSDSARAGNPAESQTNYSGSLDLDGQAGNDTLIGGSGNDSIDGGSGDDTINGGTGDDTIVCSTGVDSLSYDDVGRAVGVTIDLSTATFSFPDGESSPSPSSCETLIGTAFNDSFKGNITTNRFDALGGVDAISYLNDGRVGGVSVNLSTGAGPEGDVLLDFENLTGTTSNDVLTGNAAVNTLDGGSGNDTLIGGLGGDSLVGGTGADTASWADGRATGVVESISNQALNTDGDVMAGIENLTGGGGNDVLTGNAAVNTLDGGSGNDTLIGGLGGDTLVGGTGTQDVITYADGRTTPVTVNLSQPSPGNNTDGDTYDATTERFVGSDAAAADTLTGSSGDDHISGANGPDTIVGDAGADQLFGDAGNDDISAGSGDDTIAGGGGNDTLDGLAGEDIFDGGDGDDTLKAVDAAKDTGTCGLGNDIAELDAVDDITDCETTKITNPVVPAVANDPGPAIDSDKDGIAAGVDCNDADPNIKPGAAEIVGNAVDENCDGLQAPFPPVTSRIDTRFVASAAFSTFKTLRVRAIPPGAAVKVTCKNRKKTKTARRSCAFKSKTFKFPTGKPALNLVKLLKKRKLAVGTVLRIEITAPGMFGKALALTVKRRKVVKKTLCLPPPGTAQACTA